MDRSQLLDAISKVNRKIELLTQELVELRIMANEFGLLQYTTNIDIDIQKLCEVLEVDYKELIGKSRIRQLCDSRAIIAYHLVHTFQHRRNRVALHLKKDHTTVLNMLDRHERFIDIDEAYKQKSDMVRDSYYINSKVFA